MENDDSYVNYINPIKQLGWFKTDRIIMHDKRLSFLTRSVLQMYISYAGNNNNAFPSRARVAKDLEISISAVSEHNAILTKLGYIKRVTTTTGNNRTITHTYILDYENDLYLQELARSILDARKNQPSKSDDEDAPPTPPRTPYAPVDSPPTPPTTQNKNQLTTIKPLPASPGEDLNIKAVEKAYGNEVHNEEIFDPSEPTYGSFGSGSGDIPGYIDPALEVSDQYTIDLMRRMKKRRISCKYYHDNPALKSRWGKILAQLAKGEISQQYIDGKLKWAIGQHVPWRSFVNAVSNPANLDNWEARLPAKIRSVKQDGNTPPPGCIAVRTPDGEEIWVPDRRHEFGTEANIVTN